MQATRTLALCLIGACYSTPQPDCGFVCGPAGDCPSGYQCASDQRCHRIGAPSSLMCEMPPDARPPRDVAPSDSPVDVSPDADVTAPTIFASVPSPGTTGNSRSTTITVTFTEDVTGVDTTSLTVAIGVNAVTGTIATQSAATYVFTPDSLLTPNATVTVSLSAAIMDLAANALVPTSFTFDTGI